MYDIIVAVQLQVNSIKTLGANTIRAFSYESISGSTSLKSCRALNPSFLPMQLFANLNSYQLFTFVKTQKIYNIFSTLLAFFRTKFFIKIIIIIFSTYIIYYFLVLTVL